MAKKAATKKTVAKKAPAKKAPAKRIGSRKAPEQKVEVAQAAPAPASEAPAAVVTNKTRCDHCGRRLTAQIRPKAGTVCIICEPEPKEQKTVLRPKS